MTYLKEKVSAVVKEDGKDKEKIRVFTCINSLDADEHPPEIVRKQESSLPRMLMPTNVFNWEVHK